jgi:hypothetical protein
MKAIVVAVSILALVCIAYANVQDCIIGCRMVCGMIRQSDAETLKCKSRCEPNCKRFVTLSDSSDTCEQLVQWVRNQLRYGSSKSIAQLCREAGLSKRHADKIGAGLPVEMIC